MHFVGHVDWSFADRPQPPSTDSQGLARRVLVGPGQGAVHTELAVGALQPGGWLQRHFHSFEEALYVLEGELLLDLDGQATGSSPGDFALIPLGMWHALGNAGIEPVRWLSRRTRRSASRRMPAARTRSSRRSRSTSRRSARGAERPAFGDPTAALRRPLRRHAAAGGGARARPTRRAAGGRSGRDTALIVYSGIA